MSPPNTPDHGSMLALWNLCRAFIDVQEIRAAETAHHSDDVAEAAPEFIASIAEIVGYAEPEEP